MPFIVAWPGKISPGRSDALISQVDLLASLAALTGAEISSGYASDSQNLIETLTGNSETGRDHLIQQGVKMKSIRKGAWKYVPEGEVTNRGKIGIFYRDEIAAPGALFYLPEDPAEQTNLADIYPAKVDEMKSLLEIELGPQSKQDDSGDQLGGAVDK